MKKNLIILAVVILALVGAYIAKTKFITNGTGGAVACTMEAKICPDGSAVGRSGPNCEFEPCPVVTAKKIISATYNCAAGKNIRALFYDEKADLTLSDGRKLLLLHTISASGARYTNSDQSFVFWNKGNTAFVEEKNKMTFSECLTTDNDQSSAQMANPASANCQKVGGRLTIEKRGDGGEYGLCNFEDNRACEEWALMRGQCPVGGMRTTGYDTIDQKYCAWAGGQTLATPNSVCTFKNGSRCSTLDFYNGQCSPTK